MYTRCPECQTAFRITVAQLKARDGLVRCGRCDSVFRADLRLFAPPAGVIERDETPEEETFIELTETTGSEAVSTEEQSESEIPIVSDFSRQQPQRHGLTTVLWSFGVVLLGVMLAGQFAYFYRHELAQLQPMRPLLVRACTYLQCEVAALHDKSVPELVQTSIAPHPRYANALRIRAHIVNRTKQPLALPLLQVTLTDHDGKLLARRTFTPRDYLDPTTAATPLGPSIAIQALLDVINPDNKAAGYEVQLFRPHTSIR